MFFQSVGQTWNQCVIEEWEKKRKNSKKLHKLFINGQYFASILHNRPERKRALELHVAQHVRSEKIQDSYLQNQMFRTWLTEMKKARMLNKYPTHKNSLYFQISPSATFIWLAYSLDDGTLPVSAPFPTHLHIQYKQCISLILASHWECIREFVL